VDGDVGAVGGPVSWFQGLAWGHWRVEGGGEIGQVTIGVLEIFELDGHELLGVLWRRRHLAAVQHDEFAVGHGFAESLQLCLEHVDVGQGGDSLSKVRDLGESIHVVLDLADDVGIKDSLGEQPVPNDKELLTGRLVGGVKDSGAFVLNTGAEKFSDDLESLVSVRIELARLLSSLGQLRFHGSGELGFGLMEDRTLGLIQSR